MKKIYGFAFASAIMMLASCSNDNEPANIPAPAPEEGGYLAVNIATPAGTRGEAGELKAGEKEENYAKEGTFLFFQGEKQTQVPQSVLLDWENDLPSTTPAGVEKVSKAIVVVAGNSAENKPDGVLVILNDPFGPAHYTGMTLTQVMAETAKEANSVSTTNSFIMTNSSYYVDDKVQVATPISDNVKQSREEASKPENAVNIYVERLAAKVQPVKGTKFEIKSTGDFQVNGITGKINLTPVITGISVANVANDEYLFKHIDTDWLAQWTAVNEAANFRSNWATIPTTTYANMSYNAYDATLGDEGFTADLAPIYIKENTSATKSALLVTAKLTLDGEEAIDALVRWAGLYYTPSSFTVQALNFTQGYYKQNDKNEYVSLVAEDLAYLTKEEHAALVGTEVGSENKSEFHAYEQALQYVGKDQLYKQDGVKEDGTPNMVDASADDLNDILLDKANRCWYWNEGKAYYFVNIEHYGAVDSSEEAAYDFREGVVRNNIYQITINSLSGIGVPVFNPELIIIPEKVKDELWYLGADINILKWKLVKQTADFNDVPL